ncbi:MAG: hypothetical protein HYR98_00370 [Nitrospirae bacterium]|nr:hypothetical protein [Nitrospirota bacterium]
MSRVIQNLVLNAEQAMSQSGTVRIRCENVRLTGEERDPAVVLPPGKYVRISVQDHGAGIAPENLQRIFEPYFTTKRKGTGLGLAATYSIVRNHGGHIAVESALGRGTTFTVYLPVSEAAAPARKEADERRSAGEGKGRRILVVDDEEMVRDLAVRILEHAGYAASSAREGAEAVELYRSGYSEDAAMADFKAHGFCGVVAKPYKMDDLLAAVEEALGGSA